MILGPAMRRKTLVIHWIGRGPQTGQLMSSALAVGYEVTTHLTRFGYKGTTHYWHVLQDHIQPLKAIGSQTLSPLRSRVAVFSTRDFKTSRFDFWWPAFIFKANSFVVANFITFVALCILSLTSVQRCALWVTTSEAIIAFLTLLVTIPIVKLLTFVCRARNFVNIYRI